MRHRVALAVVLIAVCAGCTAPITQFSPVPATGSATPETTVATALPGSTVVSTDSATVLGVCANESTTRTGPAAPYDTVTLYQVPDYVSEYADTVIVSYDELDSAPQTAVRRALTANGTYRQCTEGLAQTDVMALFSAIEERWTETGTESFDQTYLHYEGRYYAIGIIQEGDHVRVDSVPCTEHECPTTPTPS